MYDLIIIGAGPAGLSAAIYASRARLNAIVIEQNYVNGGQIIDTYEIDNYPGLPGLSGMDLAMKMAEHAEKLGVTTVNGFVQSLDLTGPVKKVITDEDTYEAKAVIIASGPSTAVKMCWWSAAETSLSRTPSSLRAAAIKFMSATAEMSCAPRRSCRRISSPFPTWKWSGIPT